MEPTTATALKTVIETEEDDAENQGG